MELMEDDVFFADLSRQISLLIMDDDEKHPVVVATHTFQGFSGDMNLKTESQLMYDHQQAWRRSDSKGTGVFIPKSTYTRKKYRHMKSVAKSSSNRSSQVKSHVNTSSSNHNFSDIPPSRC